MEDGAQERRGGSDCGRGAGGRGSAQEEGQRGGGPPCALAPWGRGDRPAPRKRQWIERQRRCSPRHRRQSATRRECESGAPRARGDVRVGTGAPESAGAGAAWTLSQRSDCRGPFSHSQLPRPPRRPPQQAGQQEEGQGPRRQTGSTQKGRPRPDRRRRRGDARLAHAAVGPRPEEVPQERPEAAGAGRQAGGMPRVRGEARRRVSRAARKGRWPAGPRRGEAARETDPEAGSQWRHRSSTPAPQGP